MNTSILTADAIRDATANIAAKIFTRTGYPIHVHVIMNGAFMFASDFLRMYPGKIADVYFPLVRRGYSTGAIHLPHLLKATAPTINPRVLRTHVILDVIVEEGLTINHYLKYFPKVLRPRVIVAALIQKGKTALPEGWIIGRKFDSVGFLYGYGMGPERHWNSIFEREG